MEQISGEVSLEKKIEIAHSISEKVKIINQSQDQRRMSFETLYEPMNAEERALLDKVRGIDPTQHGFSGKFFGITEPPTDLVAIPNSFNEQYVPENVAQSFKRMNEAMYAEIGKRIVVLSGYRSPAYQLVLFLWNLRENNFDIDKVCKIATLPGYSEHGVPDRQAIDIMCEGEQPKTGSDSTFQTTLEYEWLKKNASKFGFHESYPKDNVAGVQYEPWHWHHEVL